MHTRAALVSKALAKDAYSLSNLRVCGPGATLLRSVLVSEKMESILGPGSLN